MDYCLKAVHACLHGELVKLKESLNSGCDVNTRSFTDGSSLLMVAARRGHKNLVDLLISRKARINDVNQTGETALMLAGMYGHYEAFRALIYSWAADIDKENHSGFTALILVTGNLKHNSHLQCIQLLLEQDAEVDIRNRMGMSAAMYCVYSKTLGLAALKMLQNGGANMDDVSDHGESLLMLAVRQRHVDIVEYLLSSSDNFDIDIHRINSDGDNVLIIALKLLVNNSHLVDTLLQFGCHPNSKSGCGCSALNIAAACSFEVTRLLISFGAVPKLSFIYMAENYNYYPSVRDCGPIFSPVDVAVMNENFSTAFFLLNLVGCRPYSLFDSYTSVSLNQRNTTSQNLELAIDEMIRRAMMCPQWVEAVRKTVRQPKPLKQICAAVISKMAGDFSGRRERLSLSGLPPLLVRFVMLEVDEKDFHSHSL